MLQTIKRKLHKVIFPQFHSSITRLENEKENRDIVIKDLSEQKRRMEMRLLAIEREPPEPALSDLMREIVGLTTLNFSNVTDDGSPRHFLDTDNKDKRSQYLTELHQIYQTEVWPVMCQNHIDTQGNFSFRTAESYDQMLAGRFSVNGISLLRNDVKRGHDEYMDRSKPPDDFDEFETTEGVIIKKED